MREKGQNVGARSTFVIEGSRREPTTSGPNSISMYDVRSNKDLCLQSRDDLPSVQKGRQKRTKKSTRDRHRRSARYRQCVSLGTCYMSTRDVYFRW